MTSHLERISPVALSSRTPMIVARSVAGRASACVSLVAGAALPAVHATQRDSSGFYASGSHLIATPTHALVAKDLNVGTRPAALALRPGANPPDGARTATGQRPVFVGVSHDATSSPSICAASATTRSATSTWIRSP